MGLKGLRLVCKLNFLAACVIALFLFGVLFQPVFALDSEEERTDEAQIIKDLQNQKEEIKNFKLIEGISALRANIPSSVTLKIQEDSGVFLVDIGPKEMYTESNEIAPINNVAYAVEEYIES